MVCAVFLFFAGIVLVMGTWTILFLPETKGSDLENTFRLFQNHWFWGKKTAVGQIHSVELPSHNAPVKEGYENGNGNGAANGDAKGVNNTVV